MNRTAATTALTAAVLTLTACGGGGGSLPTVSGRLDEVKHVKAVKAKTETATRTVPTFTNRCETRTRTKTVNGKVKTETYQDCTKVETGTRQETYTRTLKPGKPARWCVELDRVNSRDDVWFTVSQSTYDKWHGKREGKKVKSMPYLRKGC